MAIKMKSDKGSTAETYSAEPGTYSFELTGATIDLGSEYENPSNTYPQVRLVWRDDADESFYDSFIKLPLGFRLNGKAKWTNRLAALIGRPITDADAELLEISLDDDSIESYDDLHDAVAAGAKVTITDLTFEGHSLFGRRAMLTLGLNGKGRPVCSANGASPMPRARTKATPPAQAAAPAKAPERPAKPAPAPAKADDEEFNDF